MKRNRYVFVSSLVRTLNLDVIRNGRSAKYAIIGSPNELSPPLLPRISIIRLAGRLAAISPKVSDIIDETRFSVILCELRQLHIWGFSTIVNYRVSGHIGLADIAGITLPANDATLEVSVYIPPGVCKRSRFQHGTFGVVIFSADHRIQILENLREVDAIDSENLIAATNLCIIRPIRDDNRPIVRVCNYPTERTSRRSHTNDDRPRMEIRFCSAIIRPVQ
jgi:hypothetical protein